MTTDLILTVIGDDRPGLVESLARTVAEHDGNWLHSSMSQLAGKFAGILHVSVPEAQADALITALDGLSDRLRVVVEKGGSDAVAPLQRSLTLQLVGNDRPGIIRDISQALARHGVNVEDLETACEPAPMSSEPLFRAAAVLRVPADLDEDSLRATLERIADDLIVDLTLD